jgi:hypothetical protein
MTLAISANAFGQLQTGTYRQGDSLWYSDLKIYPNKKFSFYDTRNASCWLWSKYEGSWKLDNDTLTFAWQTYWQEDGVHESKAIDKKSNAITLTFKYDDGEPIPNVKVCYACDFLQDCQYFLTDKEGKVSLPKERLTDYKNKDCTEKARRLYYEIKSKFIEFSSNGERDSQSNVFVITVKKHRESGHVTETRQFIVSNGEISYINPKEENTFKNWGEFKFLTKKYGR